jgi:hypothetical protein
MKTTNDFLSEARATHGASGPVTYRMLDKAEVGLAMIRRAYSDGLKKRQKSAIKGATKLMKAANDLYRWSTDKAPPSQYSLAGAPKVTSEIGGSRTQDETALRLAERGLAALQDFHDDDSDRKRPTSDAARKKYHKAAADLWNGSNYLYRWLTQG